MKHQISWELVTWNSTVCIKKLLDTTASALKAGIHFQKCHQLAMYWYVPRTGEVCRHASSNRHYWIRAFSLFSHKCTGGIPIAFCREHIIPCKAWINKISASWMNVDREWGGRAAAGLSVLGRSPSAPTQGVGQWDVLWLWRSIPKEKLESPFLRLHRWIYGWFLSFLFCIISSMLFLGWASGELNTFLSSLAQIQCRAVQKLGDSLQHPRDEQTVECMWASDTVNPLFVSWNFKLLASL